MEDDGRVVERQDMGGFRVDQLPWDKAALLIVIASNQAEKKQKVEVNKGFLHIQK